MPCGSILRLGWRHYTNSWPSIYPIVFGQSVLDSCPCSDSSARTLAGLENPSVAHWAVPWIQQSVLKLAPRVELCAAPSRLLRTAVLEHGAQMNCAGSIHADTRSRILSLVCLRLKTGGSLPSIEMVSLLETLGVLCLTDNGYVKSWSSYITSFLSGQPKSLEGQRTAVLKSFGRVLSLSSILDSDLLELAQGCLKVVPKKLRSSTLQEILVTGPMWSRIAENKLGVVPPTFIVDLSATIASFSLPKIIASRESVQSCTLVLDMALRIALAQEKARKSKQSSSALQPAIIKLCDIIWTNLDLIRRIGAADGLEKHALRASASLNLENTIDRILAVLSSADSYWPTMVKKEALKCLFRVVKTSHGSDEHLKRLLFEATSEHLDSCPQSALHDLSLQIQEHLSASRGFGLGYSHPSSDFMGTFGLSSRFSSSTSSAERSPSDLSKALDSIASINIVCNGGGDTATSPKESAGIETHATEDRVEMVCRYFDDMSSADAILAVFNKYPLPVLEKLDAFLAGSVAFEKKDALDDLQLLLQQHLDLKDADAPSGWFKYYQRFEAHPKALKETILLCLDEPKLLSHSLLLFHVRRFLPSTTIIHPSLSVSTSQEIRPPQPSAATREHNLTLIPGPSTETSSHIVNEHPSDDERANLKKRKELALKMIDDLEAEESTPKRFAAPASSFHSNGLDAINIIDTVALNSNMDTDPGEIAGAPSRVTRSRAKSATAKPAAITKKSASKKAKKSGSDDTMVIDATGDAPDEPKLDEPKDASNGAKKTANKKDSKKKAGDKKKEPTKRQVCNHWLQHRCYKGSDCPFLHEGTQVTYDTICKFFRTGNCAKGAACPYSHDLKTEACANLVSADHCKFGERCLYSHEPGRIAAAKSALAARKKEEEAQKAEQEKEKSLSFAQHLVPLSFQPPMEHSPFAPASFQPSYSAPYSSYSGDAAESTSAMATVDAYIGNGDSHRMQVDQVVAESEAAYVPPTLVGLNVAPFSSTQIAPAASSMLPPPSLTSNTIRKPPTL